MRVTPQAVGSTAQRLPDEGGERWKGFPSLTRTLKGFRSVAVNQSQHTSKAHAARSFLPDWHALYGRRVAQMADGADRVASQFVERGIERFLRKPFQAACEKAFGVVGLFE